MGSCFSTETKTMNNKAKYVPQNRVSEVLFAHDRSNGIICLPTGD